MDILNMLMTAKVYDTDGNLLGDVLAVRFMAGHMVVTIYSEDEDEGDDDGGEEIKPEERGGLTLVQPILQKKKAKGGNHG